MQNYQRKSYVTQLHKVYNEAQQAAFQYITERNALDLKEAGLTSTDAVKNWVKTYFNVVNDCGTDYSPCFASEYKMMNGVSRGALFNNTTCYKFVLASGASISVAGHSNGNVSFFVDVNGKAGPNIIGRDTFAMLIYKNGIIDESDGSEGDDTLTAPLTKDKREDLYQKYCANGTASSYWWGCFGKILNDNWDMTY